MREPDRPAWHDLVERHLGLVRQVARRLHGRLPGCVQVDDLVSAGYVGLCQAAQRFEPARGVQFRTYAQERVRGAMIDWLRAMDYIPRRTRQSTPPDEIPMKVSYDHPAVDSREGPYGFRPTAEYPGWGMLLPGPNGCPVAHAMAQEWPAIYHGLHPIEQRIVDMRYREEKTLKAIGAHLGLHESRICQMHTEILARWRLWVEQTEGMGDE